VNVYVVVAVLFKAGDHVPSIPLFEVVGNALILAPEQIGATCVKVGVVACVKETVTVSWLWHPVALKVAVTVYDVSTVGETLARAPEMFPGFQV
jgi:hypothetical protein